MPFLDHIEELRWRILRSLLAVVVATLVGWVIVERVDVLGLLIRPIAPLIPGGRLKFTSPTEPFFITLKFAFVIGLLLASPYIIYQVWAFLSPALYERERRVIMPALSVGVLLFLAGAAAAYYWVLPRALRVLLSFQQSVLEPIITANNYFGFAAQIIAAFGLITELPLVIVILAALGVVTPEFLARNRRYAIVISAIAAALLSPPDAVSMVLMMVPLWLLYELSIVCAWVVTRRRARRERTGQGAALVLVLCLGAAGGLRGQARPPRPDSAGSSVYRPGRRGPSRRAMR
jgi:sec-independent protein translocase protein TatC